MEERDGAEEDGLWGLHRTPPLRRVLVAKFVLPGGVEDGYAEFSVVVDVRVEGNRVLEGESWWEVRVGWWKLHESSKEAAWDRRISLRVWEDQVRTRTSVVFAVIVDHQHNLPFEDVVIIDQTA